ncbi:DUF3833 domain-containing protein [Microbulbifer flavimaris]|uniref:DUF3833 domain-containing protein n=1 Tax=Microbulbifer flavimaris TaxID=1781068 RepID=A0ABX4HY67_9GAMM|nr:MULTISPECIES: DUF3833 domain-containing protein [Microbulbifer]KUJ83160.1 hypothetical protein AVO43_10130 [Microbulbifer sp. ZGT114]PCO05085.1 DUF3833 domain-containing protein [Microbulbifer flavimaris]
MQPSHLIASKPILTLLCALTLVACSSAGIEHYQDKQPQMVPEEFFLGPLTAHGVLKDRTGTVTRRFNADLQGSWDDGVGLLAERFVFDDGEIQFRNWQLIPTTSDTPGVRTYIGRAEDVVGDAEVQVSGNAMFIRYVLEVPYKGDTIEVNVDDRMYLVSDRVLINESRLTKFGIPVGEIVLTIIRGPGPLGASVSEAK